LRPVSTWNPVIINFKHVYQIFKDAWYTEHFIDKLKIWFMPTGWRPEDVKENFPLKEINNPEKQIKYKTNNSSIMLTWSWVQHILAGMMMFHLFMVMNIDKPLSIDYMYAVFIIVHIFSFTSALDNNKFSIIAELFKIILGFTILYIQDYIWFNLSGIFVLGIICYFILSFLFTFIFQLQTKKLHSL